MIEIAEIIAIKKIDTGRIEIDTKIERSNVKKIRKLMKSYRYKFPCPSKYPCLLFLERDANEKDQDLRLTTTAETKPTTKVSFGTRFHGYRN